jgi:hypothetical protein
MAPYIKSLRYYGCYVVPAGVATVVSVAGVPLEARWVCGQFHGQEPEAQGPQPPRALTAPW